MDEQPIISGQSFGRTERRPQPNNLPLPAAGGHVDHCRLIPDDTAERPTASLNAKLVIGDVSGTRQPHRLQ